MKSYRMSAAWNPFLFLIFFFLTVLIFVISGAAPVSGEVIEVKVGGYVFPPFVEKSDSGYSGLTPDFIETLNRFQNQYHFSFVLTSPKRRFRDFETGYFDMIVFESIQWGWKDKALEASRVFLKGGEVYVTRADPEKDQKYFDDLKGKKLLGFLGYHYGFADFNADESYLKRNFSITLTNSHERNIEMVLRNRADVAVVTISFLNQYLLNHPDAENRLLVSSRLDQEYLHTILVRKNSRPSADEINGFLDEMEKRGVLSELLLEYGIRSGGASR